MKTSEKIEAIVSALVKAEEKISDPKRDGNNPHFRSKYITLDAVIEATRKPLASEGVKVIQSPSTNERGVTVTTRLVHGASGEWIEDDLTMPLPSSATPQAVGSAITYARRYALLAMLNLGGEDDDGTAATDAANKAAAKQQPRGNFPGVVEDVIVDVQKAERKNKAGKAYTLFSIFTEKNGEVNTFDNEIGGVAEKYAGTGTVVRIKGEPNGNYAPKCLGISPIGDPADDLPF